MEAFEHIAKVYLESLGYAVSTNVKFPVRKRTKKKARKEYQTHGYEVDLVAARANELLLCSVKSFLGSHGLNRQFFQKIADPGGEQQWKMEKLLNDPVVRQGIIAGAAERYGYPKDRILLGLFVGKFNSGDEQDIRAHLKRSRFGCGKLRLFDLQTIAAGVVADAERKTYRDDPVIVALKCLHKLGWLTEDFRNVVATAIQETKEKLA